MAKPYRLLQEKMSPENQREAARRAGEMLREMALQDLRQALGLTQMQMAELMQITQPGVSKIEAQSDIYVSTLRQYVAALGGQLTLVAKLPDREVTITQFVAAA